MALIVETGAGVAGANTFVSRADFIAYAALRGVVIADDDPADVLLIKAMDYLNGLKWKGTVKVPFQPNAFPRSYVYVGPDLFSDLAVPADVVGAQCTLAMQINAGVDILPTFTGGLVTEETVGPLTTKYSDRYGAPTGSPDMPSVRALLAKWLDTEFKVVRA
jgi:hypothetical protein